MRLGLLARVGSFLQFNTYLISSKNWLVCISCRALNLRSVRERRHQFKIGALGV
jgi:hypothetical protein